MTHDRIVLAVNVYDNADTLQSFIDWHLSLGIDFVVAFDAGSSDGSCDILARAARSQPLSWSHQPRRNIEHFDPLTELGKMARDRFDADWILLADADEFLSVPGRPLRDILDTALSQNLSALCIPRFNMTGPLPPPRTDCLSSLNVRIVRTTAPSQEEMIDGNISCAQVFVGNAPKTLVRAGSFVKYAFGGHAAQTSSGETGGFDDLLMLHYPFRSFDAFELKARNIAAWLPENPHLPPWWGWQWRRYARLLEAGQLRVEYERQFVASVDLPDLLADGTCEIDNTLADWMRRPSSHVPGGATFRSRTDSLLQRAHRQVRDLFGFAIDR